MENFNLYFWLKDLVHSSMIETMQHNLTGMSNSEIYDKFFSNKILNPMVNFYIPKNLPSKELQPDFSVNLGFLDNKNFEFFKKIFFQKLEKINQEKVFSNIITDIVFSDKKYLNFFINKIFIQNAIFDIIENPYFYIKNFFQSQNVIIESKLLSKNFSNYKILLYKKSMINIFKFLGYQVVLKNNQDIENNVFKISILKNSLKTETYELKFDNHIFLDNKNFDNSCSNITKNIDNDIFKYNIFSNDFKKPVYINTKLSKTNDIEDKYIFILYNLRKIKSIIDSAKINFNISYSDFKSKKYNLSLLDQKYELDIIKNIILFPQLLDYVLSSGNFSSLTNYLFFIASLFDNINNISSLDTRFIILENKYLTSSKIAFLTSIYNVISDGFKILQLDKKY